jgi:hypothetical protein
VVVVSRQDQTRQEKGKMTTSRLRSGGAKEKAVYGYSARVRWMPNCEFRGPDWLAAGGHALR